MKNIRIGTRNSPLALWQAREVARHLQNMNHTTEIVPISACGDKDLSQPLYEMGITGIFTRDLDLALLRGDIDIAVHSLKDVPTQLPQNIQLVACLQRDYPEDVLVRNPNSLGKTFHDLSIATSSLRRRAFWLKEYSGTHFEDIRGNVHTRLKKIEDGLADATVFSLAGIKRLSLPIEYEMLPFMIPAPSQGVVAVAGHSENEEVNAIVKQITHTETEICVQIERDFLRTLEGGCTAPIGAYCEVVDHQLRFRGRLCSLDGERCIETEEVIELNAADGAGQRFAENILKNGGREIMNEINAVR